MSQFNSFFIATGSNLGDRLLNLNEAKSHLEKHFSLISESRVYESAAVDYVDQPNFYNQVLEFELTSDNPETVMTFLLSIEKIMGRNRIIPKGPRLIDIDILFWGLEKIKTPNLEIPHPRLFDRSFVVLPLSELPGFKILKAHFSFNYSFDNHAIALS